MRLRQHKHIGIFLFVLIVALLSRFYGLDRLSLWADELWVVIASVTGSLTDMISAVYYHDNHPPGYYVLVRYTQFILGSSDFAIRLPSALAGTALVAATYAVGKKMFTAKAGVFAAALVAGSYQAIYYSQEARPNIFMALFALLAFYYFCIILLADERTYKNYFLFWMSAACCSYFHYAGLVFCACLGLVCLALVVFKRNREDFISGLKLFLPVVVLYLPWALGTLRHLVATPVTGWQRPPDMNTLKTTFQFLFGPDAIRIIFYQIIFSVSMLMVFISATGLLKNKNNTFVSEDRQPIVLSALAMILLPVGVFYIKSIFSQDAYNHRHFLYAIPLLALLAGYYFDEIIRRFAEAWQGKILVIVVIMIILYQLSANNSRNLYTANHFKQEFREAALVVANDMSVSKSAPDGRISAMVVSNTPFFDHYLNRFTNAQYKSEFIYDWDQKLPALQAMLAERHVAAFYYLEAPIMPGANNMITAEDLALMHIYQPLCRTRFSRAQVFKFSALDKPSSTDVALLLDCRTEAK